MATHPERVLILPVALHGDVPWGPAERGPAGERSPGGRPRFRDFAVANPDLVRAYGFPVLRRAYRALHALVFRTEWQVLNLNDVLRRLALELYRDGYWAWNLEELAQRAMDYLSGFFGLRRQEAERLRLELADALSPLLAAVGHATANRVELVVESFAAEIEASRGGFSEAEILERLAARDELRCLPRGTLSDCVGAAMAVLLEKGFIEPAGGRTDET